MVVVVGGGAAVVECARRSEQEAPSMAMLEYGAVPQELVDMSEELEALGGGDTRLASAEVHCRARPARAGAGGIIQEVDGGVAVRCAIRRARRPR